MSCKPILFFVEFPNNKAPRSFDHSILHAKVIIMSYLLSFPLFPSIFIHIIYCFSDPTHGLPSSVALDNKCYGILLHDMYIVGYKLVAFSLLFLNLSMFARDQLWFKTQSWLVESNFSLNRSMKPQSSLTNNN